MKYILLIGSLLAVTAHASNSYFVKKNGAVISIPTSHEVIIQPKGFNSKAFSFQGNLEGMVIDRDGYQKWPLLDALCAIYYPEDGLQFSPKPPKEKNKLQFSGSGVNACDFERFK